MSDERPSDALQPNAKRRAAGQGSKDDVEEEEEVVDPGAWKPVDADEIAKRRKVRVRRTGGAEPEPAEGPTPASGNPFAGIALAAPAAPANPFSGFNLVPPAGGQSAAPKETEQAKDATDAVTPEPAAAGADKGAEAKEKPAEGEAAKPVTGDAKEAAAGSTTPAAGFGFGFASGSNNPFAALTSSSKTGGFGGFGGFGSAQPSKAGDTPAATPSGFTPLFGGGASKPSGFSFGTSAFPSIGTTPKPAGGADDGEEGGEEGKEGSVELFNDSTAEFRPVVTLPDQKTVTGEEEESVAFTADGVLFEFEPASSKWRERGRGEFRLNLDKASQARMVMRQAGNYRLLLNAKVYSGMAVQKMTGDVGVTFACANAASALEPSTPSTDKKEGEAAGSASTADATPKLATWCLKIKNKEHVSRLFDLLTHHKSASPAP